MRDLEHEYKKSTRWLMPLFVAALLLLFGFVIWRALSQNGGEDDEHSRAALSRSVAGSQA